MKMKNSLNGVWILPMRLATVLALSFAFSAGMGPNAGLQSAEAADSSGVTLSGDEGSSLLQEKHVIEAGAVADKPATNDREYLEHKGGGIINPVRMRSEAGVSRDSKLSDEQKARAKSKISPDSLMLQSSLKSALIHVKGMQAQFKTSTDAEAMAALQSHSKELTEDLQSAKLHETKLKSEVNRIPEVAKSEEFKEVDQAITQSQSSYEQWRAKASGSGYWKNADQASKDLDELEKNLSQAVDKSKNLNSFLDLKNIG